MDSQSYRPTKRPRLEDISRPEYAFTQDQVGGFANLSYSIHETMAALPSQQQRIDASTPNAMQFSFDTQLQYSNQWIAHTQPYMPQLLHPSPSPNEAFTYVSTQPTLAMHAPSSSIHEPIQPINVSTLDYVPYQQPYTDYAQYAAGSWQSCSIGAPEGAFDFQVPSQTPNLTMSPKMENHEDLNLVGSDDSGMIVCFGVIPNIFGTYDQKGLKVQQSEYRVKLESSERFAGLGDDQISGRILSEHSQMVQGLLDEQSLQLFVSCIPDMGMTMPKSNKPSRISKCTLEITVYGPMELCEEIGSWFEEYEIYLQDPRLCYMDTKYCNPQRLSFGDLELCPLVSDVTKRPDMVQVQDIPSQPDMLDILSSHDDLEEAAQPTAIKTILKKHQRQALTFMLQRENGWALDRSRPDIWEEIETNQSLIYINKISNAHQSEEPPEFYGGIIADPMGLGKTLTMIALVANDLDLNPDPAREISSTTPIEHKNILDVSSTLVIVPPPLLDSWEDQLSEHVGQGGLFWRRHHGKDRLTDIELQSVNLVLTTYHTVSAEWKSEQATHSSILFSVRWRRIILDEAHFIRNGRSLMSRAMCELQSVSRWAVTGTPIQNRLTDLSSLLKFIRAAPYDDPRQFDIDISQLWKSGEDELAVQRLKYISTCLLLRRPKATINLPPRRDLLFPVGFRQEERTAYEALRQQAIARLDEALSNNHASQGAIVYANALQQIESLRLFSNLGLHYHTRHDNTKVQSWANIAQQTFNTQREMGHIVCKECSSSLDLSETLLDEPVHPRHTAYLFSCLRIVCSECINKSKKDGRILNCGDTPPCPMASVSLSSRMLEEMSSTGYTFTSNTQLKLPSKVSALVADIQALPKDTKCIVFSTWRLSLDIVQSGLEQAAISCIRFDGKVAQKDRGKVVERFRQDPDVRVMLLTLSCGAVGLTLTVASRAYLMEPHWNPTLEEQALARIHRLGQTREVTTVRLYMRDSFEEQVIKVQESKKQLANVLLAPHEGAQTSDSLGTLQNLRLLL